MPRRRLIALLAAVAAVPAGGCAGQDDEDRPEQPAALVLDARPDAVHAGIFLAVARDFDGAEGVVLRVRAPRSGQDAAALLARGRADLAVLDIDDLARARRRGRDVVGVMALVQRPLGAVLAAPGVRRPRDLEGRRVAVGDGPGDAAVMAAIVRGDGGDPARVRRVPVRSRPAGALLARRVTAATGTWSTDGVDLATRRPGTRVFRADDYGAPAFPELVLCVSRETLIEERDVVRATVAALRRGYREALIDPESAVGAVVDRTRGLDRAAVQRRFDAVAPAFIDGVARFGDLDPARLRAWARWAARTGAAPRAPDVDRAFAPGL
jgi:ABC-type nitrate/sulfonate/bicarbonate transport system substrate-binding protein